MNTHLKVYQPAEDATYTKLVESSLYQTYKQAFRDATGMNLVLLPVDEEVPVAEAEKMYINPFCRQLNGDNSPCSNCAMASRCLTNTDSQRAETITCFAKMRETAIPIVSGKQVMAFLATGQVFTEAPREKDFEDVAAAITEQDPEADNLESLRQAWINSRVMPVEQYQGTITLLAAFAIQLSELVNRLVIEDANAEPEIVTKAKQFVNANLEDKVCLEEVARKVGVSTFYFCKVFKKATGMTLTEYVNRRRVEWAKRRLANPQARVTEVAYDVGYQSLSQFNRSFLKYVGMSPTRYREHQSSEAAMDRKLAAA